MSKFLQLITQIDEKYSNPMKTIDQTSSKKALRKACCTAGRAFHLRNRMAEIVFRNDSTLDYAQKLNKLRVFPELFCMNGDIVLGKGSFGDENSTEGGGELWCNKVRLAVLEGSQSILNTNSLLPTVYHSDNNGTPTYINLTTEKSGDKCTLKIGRDATTTTSSTDYTSSSSETTVLIDGNLEVTKDICAFYSSSSDIRLKSNITTIENPLTILKNIRGVRFNWNDESKKINNDVDLEKDELGVIAQEVEKVLPEIVRNGLGNYKAVRYEKLAPLLIEAIKEQQKQIDELKKIVNSLL